MGRNVRAEESRAEMVLGRGVPEPLIRQVVTIDESQFGFVPGRGTTDAIFFIRQLQEEYFTVSKHIYMAFVDLSQRRRSTEFLRKWSSGQ